MQYNVIKKRVERRKSHNFRPEIIRFYFSPNSILFLPIPTRVWGLLTLLPLSQAEKIEAEKELVAIAAKKITEEVDAEVLSVSL